jgi:xanthine dehydrogenase accessory factor
MPGVDEFFGRVAELHREGAAFAIATVVSRRGPVSSHAGDRAIVFADGVMEGFVGGSCSREAVRAQALDALAHGEPRLVSIRPDADADDDRDGVVCVPMTCGSKGAVDVYIEPFARARIVVVVGLTPVAEAVVRLSTTLEYRVVRAVAREELRDVTAEGPRTIAVDELASFLAGQPLASRTQIAIVVASQGHYDGEALAAVLAAGAPYVGLVASRRRAAEVRAELVARGHDGAAIDALRVPAGLDLGARHPAEVALSILAEIVQLSPSPRAFGGGTPPAAAVAAPRVVRDPVCGMEVVLVEGAVVAEHAGDTFGFCCNGCRERFLAGPAAYLAKAAG